MHENTKSPTHVINLSSIEQNDDTSMVIIKTYNRAHKSQNCRKKNIIHVQKHHKTLKTEVSQTGEKIVKLEFNELEHV